MPEKSIDIKQSPKFDIFKRHFESKQPVPDSEFGALTWHIARPTNVSRYDFSKNKDRIEEIDTQRLDTKVNEKLVESGKTHLAAVLDDLTTRYKPGDLLVNLRITFKTIHDLATSYGMSRLEIEELAPHNYFWLDYCINKYDTSAIFPSI